MNNKAITAFKREIEEVAKDNFDDYDAVEYMDGFSYTAYNDACTKIHQHKESYGEVTYLELFTEEEMLTVGVMYACIMTGAINSDLTKQLNDNWRSFEREVTEMTDYYYNYAR